MQLAEEILTRPADDDMNGDYADEDWRCPVCHRKAVELLPLSKGLRRARLVCLVLLALPLILFAIQKLLPDPQFTRVLDHGLKYWPIWLLSGSIGILVILFAKRRKRCCECGHEWAHGSSAS